MLTVKGILLGFITFGGKFTIPLISKVWLSLLCGSYVQESIFQLTLACKEPPSVTIVTVAGSPKAAAVLAVPLGTLPTGVGVVILASVLSVRCLHILLH